MFIGNYNGEPCRVSKDSPNQSVCITGLSGTGKTCRLNQIELANAEAGGTVLVIDTGQTHTDGQIFLPIRERYFEAVNRIDALNDGLGLKFLKPLETPQGKTEPFVHLVNSAVQALSSGQSMGVCQLGALRKAVIAAIESLDSSKDEAQAIAFALQSQDDSRAEAVYQKLWTILNCGALKSSEKQIQPGRINIVNLAGLDKITQTSLSELYLSDIWRKIQFCGWQGEGKGLTIALDEFQHFSLKKNAVLCDMLREGRKFGINLLLATQSLEAFTKLPCPHA